MEDKSKSHERQEGKRTTQSTGKSIAKPANSIAPESGFTKKMIEERIKVFEEIMEEQNKKIAEFPRVDIQVTVEGDVIQGTSFETSPASILKDLDKERLKTVLVARVKYESRVATLDDGLVNIDDDMDLEQSEQWALFDLNRPLEGNCELQFLTHDDPMGKVVFRHSSAHILGQVMEVEHEAHLCCGPPTTDGFYYDVLSYKTTFSDDHYKKVAKAVQKIVKNGQKFERIVLTKEQALRLFAANPFKVQLITNKIAEGGRATAYRCGPLIDLCTGPHIPSTGFVKAFQVEKNSSAYWLGDADNDSLQRIYGVSFPSAGELQEYNKFKAEAKKRDHRLVGKQQQLIYHHEFSPGSWFFTGEGSHVYNHLIEFIREQYSYRGFTEVISPNLYNLRLWKVSGHYQKYKENMFMFHGDNCGYGVKPMNCPGHHLLFQSQSRSYRDLPLRFADFGVLHRNELAGALGGLTRVR